MWNVETPRLLQLSGLTSLAVSSMLAMKVSYAISALQRF